MSSPKIYLITGANRGLGRGLVEALAQRPNVTIVAGVRDLENASSKSLSTLSVGAGSKIINVKIDSKDPSTVKTAVSSLSSEHNISHLDIVIANAGISKYYGAAAQTPISEVNEHFEVNAVATLVLFQETWPLLQKAEKPMFVAMSTGIASIGDMGSLPLPATAYGMSKAALNYMVRKIHFENPGLNAWVMSPGWVQTDQGNAGAAAVGMDAAPVTLEQSVTGMLDKIDNATREETSGTFQSFDETKYAW
ncbi:aflatoxin biosynthesis ketoreductase nor-1-like protein [Coleophoma crateriformis]|uniref:Aflatoxin biosynthesis ketoreductase nor-1-like protein n=1 Tax=Coleophoma crateriformis TaxID=565419 RepID=A0A3D8QID0_9HELO|nr:aflatoxin biosynthesis ketoreductase nor-1-like protein [Coleophoma crateriformis]